MTNTAHQPIKLFQFPRMFGIPNLSPFCCKLETWLRIAQIPYEVVDTPGKADTVLFNTCSVRQHAEDKIYSALGRLEPLAARWNR